MSPSLSSVTRRALKSNSLGPLMLVFMIPAVILPMTANAFDIGSLLGFDINALNQCNAEIYDRVEMDEEKGMMTIYLKNGSTMTTNSKTGVTVVDGEYPEISAECQKVYAEMENSPFVQGMGPSDDDDAEVEVARDGDRTTYTIKNYEEAEEVEEEKEEEKIDIAETAEKITDGVMKGLGKWFD